ncbi:hypothetical protein Taro_007605 [Colocasia esculenta]|uniref:Uncharacterized protein n=1 Tax=Colocasia esculenta TaxID=4460 RepID=A0A843TZI6_COLES|nr:hypothetical protein [Colocasia esculenta]
MEKERATFVATKVVFDFERSLLRLPHPLRLLRCDLREGTVLLRRDPRRVTPRPLLQLLLGGYRAVVIDNLENSSEIAIRRVAELAGDFGKNLVFHKTNGVDSIVWHWGGVRPLPRLVCCSVRAFAIPQMIEAKEEEEKSGVRLLSTLEMQGTISRSARSCWFSRILRFLSVSRFLHPPPAMTAPGCLIALPSSPPACSPSHPPPPPCSLSSCQSSPPLSPHPTSMDSSIALYSGGMGEKMGEGCPWKKLKGLMTDAWICSRAESLFGQRFH